MSFLAYRCISPICIPSGRWANLPRDYTRWTQERANEALINLMRKGILTAPEIIHPIIPLEEAPEVWRWIAQEPNKVIKFAVRF